MITKKRKREELQLVRKEALDAYMNREDFQYDVNADALYKQYQDRYTQLSKTAKEDTLGRASALTGGYGSSYAQKVGQQAYQSYRSKADDVIPELYQLAYERYRDESKRLYRNYQAWARQEQEAAQQEQRENELALQKQHRAIQNSQTQTAVTQPDYWAMLSYHQNLGKSTESKSTATNSIPDQARYDNGKVSEGNIKTMQRLLGLTDTGKWTSLEQETAGNRSADDAWLDYQQGKLQSRSKAGMSMEKWATYRNEQSKASTATDTKETTSRVENFIAGMVTEDQAAERGVSSEDWKRTVLERLNRVSLSVDEFEQLESYYGLGIASGTSNTPVDSSAPKMSYSEYREKTATKKVADLNTAVQRYFRDYQAFADSAVYDYGNVGYQNATSMWKIRIPTAAGLRQQADTLTSVLRLNTDLLAGDYSNLFTQLATTRKGIDTIMNAYDGMAKYYAQWDTEEAYNTFAKYQTMSPDEVMADQAARAATKNDFGIVFELSRTNMPYQWFDAEYLGYTRAEFDDIERKRAYIEEKYGVDLHSDIYENVHIYNDLLDELANISVDIAYTTGNGRNVTFQMLYDWKIAEEDLANRLATYSQNPDWDVLSKGIDASSDPDRRSDFNIVVDLSRTNMPYDWSDADSLGYTKVEFEDIERKRAYIEEKYGVDLHDDIYDNAYIFNEILSLLSEQSWESGELTTQLVEDANGDRTFKNMRHLTEDEKAVLNYIFNTQGRDAALQWHNSRMSIYQDRANGVLTKQMYEWGKESWSGLWGFGTLISPQSLASVALKVGSSIEQLDDWIFRDNNNTLARASSAIRSGVADTTEWMIGNWDAFDFVYNTAMKGADFVVASKLPCKTGSALSVLSVAAQATNDALDRGMSQEQVFWTGMMAGVIEGIFEIWSVGDFRALKKVASTHAKDIALNIAKSMLGKVSDATLKEVANIAYDAINNGDFSEYETKVRQYVINGKKEPEAKQKAALEIGGQIAEDIASDVFVGVIANQH